MSLLLEVRSLTCSRTISVNDSDTITTVNILVSLFCCLSIITFTIVQCQSVKFFVVVKRIPGCFQYKIGYTIVA